MWLTWLALTWPVAVAAVNAVEFKDVLIDPDFKGFLESDPLLMEVAGARIFVLPNGKCVVIAVASVPIEDESSKARLERERVGRSKAIAYFVGERDGVLVSHVETTVEQDRVQLADGRERVESVSSFLGVNESRIIGMAKGLRVVGRWKSADETIFYLAMGAVVARDGQ